MKNWKKCWWKFFQIFRKFPENFHYRKRVLNPVWGGSILWATQASELSGRHRWIRSQALKNTLLRGTLPPELLLHLLGVSCDLCPIIPPGVVPFLVPALCFLGGQTVQPLTVTRPVGKRTHCFLSLRWRTSCVMRPCGGDQPPSFLSSGKRTRSRASAILH